MAEIAKQTLYYEIVRQTSQYNKYIKWYAKVYKDPTCTQLISSCGYRTRKEAEYSINHPVILPIGDRLLETEYIERS